MITATAWGWVWGGRLNDMRAQARFSSCKTEDDAREEAHKFADGFADPDPEFGDEPRGDLGLMEFCRGCWEPTEKCECETGEIK